MSEASMGAVQPFASELEGLASPESHAEPLNIGSGGAAWLLRSLRAMLTIRLVEEAVGDLVTRGEARAPCHLGIGQEAVAVGISAHLRTSDRVFGGHRSHSHYLALGGDVYGLIAEVLGKADGVCRGMGGSMHLLARDVGFHGSVPIVGATIPIAVGAALAARLDGRGDISVAYFGDGAAEEGVFHESLNLASSLRLPVLFACENNLFSSHLDIGLRQPSDRIARFADAHKVPAVTIDGNDVVAVAQAAERLMAISRSGGGPVFIEAVTYRHRGHVGPNSDLDVGVHRKMSDLLAWKKRDPIDRLKAAMIAAGMLSEQDFQRMVLDTRASVSEATERALNAPYPELAATLGMVFVGS